MESTLLAHNPSSVHKPLEGIYAHGIEILPGSRMLFLSSQVGVTTNGYCPPEIVNQLDIAWQNVIRVLDEVEMTADSIVRVVCYLTDAAYLPEFVESCWRYLGSHKPAMSTQIVQQLMQPECLVAIEVVAAD